MTATYVVGHEHASSLFQCTETVLWALINTDVEKMQYIYNIKKMVYNWLLVRVISESWHKNVGLDVSVDNMLEWKGIREKAEKVNSRKASI
jgi:hypothetical protein